MSDNTAVLTERRGRVLLITLNRPEAMNAINTDLAQGVLAAVAMVDRRIARDAPQVGVRRDKPQRVFAQPVAATRVAVPGVGVAAFFVADHAAGADEVVDGSRKPPEALEARVRCPAEQAHRNHVGDRLWAGE